MPRTVFTAKLATSRTRPRTSTGSSRKAAEAPIILTCSPFAIAIFALVSAPAAANVTAIADPGTAYVAARAASISGNHSKAAQIYATLAARSNDSDLRERAISEAITAGDMPLALRLVRQSPATALSIDSKLLLVSDALKARRITEAAQLLSKAGRGPDLDFWLPLVQAWSAADRNDLRGAMAALSSVPKTSAFAPFVDEETAYILLKLGKTVEADAYARRAIGTAGPREFRLRLALAQGFKAAGDEQRALAMLDGISGGAGELRAALRQGRLKGAAVDTAAKAFADQLLALALEMRRSERASGSPLHVAQIARYAGPDNGAAAILLGNLLAEDGRLDDARAVYRSVSPGDPLKSDAMDAESRALLDSGRFNEALAFASAAARSPNATSEDFGRLGDVYSQMKRYDEAAAVYRQAIQRLPADAKSRTWPLLLLQASALESGGRWPEAKAALGTAIAMAPDEPLILNFLGYAKLEHGEDLDAAEALIRKASQLAPDNASITDSLGWALYKRGRFDEAIDVLQQAAANDPAQPEIQEHLGDALYAAGRHFEARFAWEAALATAEDEDSARIRGKIASGLPKTTASR